MASPIFLQQFGQGLKNILGGPQSPYLDPDENKVAAQQQKMAMLASLLKSSQPSPVPIGTLASIGGAIDAGQQSRQQSTAEALRARLAAAQFQNVSEPDRLVGVANPSDFEPESLREYELTGDPGVLKPRNNTYGRYNPRDYSAESWAEFVETGDASKLKRVAPSQFRGTAGGGVIGLDPLNPSQATTVISDQTGTQAAAERAQAEAQGAAIGSGVGTAQAAILSKAMKSENIDDILDIADPLIDEATGSGSGAIRDKLYAWFGESTSGAQAIAQLLPLQAAIMLNQPRMEGPQSDRDVQLYREAAGQIGDPSVPRATKKAALQTIRKLQQQYRKAAGEGGEAPQSSPSLQEGTVIRNPNTGERMILRNGEWVKQ